MIYFQLFLLIVLFNKAIIQSNNITFVEVFPDDWSD